MSRAYRVMIVAMMSDRLSHINGNKTIAHRTDMHVGLHTCMHVEVGRGPTPPQQVPLGGVQPLPAKGVGGAQAPPRSMAMVA